MSNVNIRRAVENIRTNTTVYTAIIEAVVNGIQAIERNNGGKGNILIRVLRADQLEIDENLSDVVGFEIEDNGIGFNDENRLSFDTLYSDQKIDEGGKGFGRFICLKYFENLHVDSTYHVNDQEISRRVFSMGKQNEIIVNEKFPKPNRKSTGTIVYLNDVKKSKSIDKKLNTIARNIVERLLPYFITENYACPEIVLSEKDGSDQIKLNDFFNNELSGVIKEVKVQNSSFELHGVIDKESFTVRVFKLFFQNNQRSRISLVAHKREVSGSAIHKYIPEFIEDFYENDPLGEKGNGKNYIIKAYVFSKYLDNNVSLERGGFEFQVENDALLGISQTDIEQEASKIAKDAVGVDIKVRQEKKKDRVQDYVDQEAPWHKEIIEKIDLSSMPYNPSNDEIESRLQKEKFSQETQIKKDVHKLLADADLGNLKDKVFEIINKISGTSKNDLIHYIAMRRNILDIFSKSLQVDVAGDYKSEGVVHDIIFPRNSNSDTTSLHKHNLWIIDERLNFTNFVSSDVAINSKDRPDLIAYDKRILFRGENEPSNPVTIFEFKKPQRDDFVNPSAKEDPIRQIVRYVNSIRDGDYKTPEGRKILIAKNTPFYGYVICDITKKVENWLERENNFKQMPDGLGWFDWLENINLYIEVISWDKVLKDAEMRNKVFFHKLGI